MQPFNPSTISVFEALDDNHIIVTQSSTCQGWYFYDSDDLDDGGNVASADRNLYNSAEEAALAALSFYKIKV